MRMCMIDIETLDTADTAVVSQIGGCIFNESGEIIQRFDIKLDWINAQNNRTISAATVDWWFKRDAGIRQAVFYSGYRFYVDEALAMLTIYLSGVDYLWSKGKFDFDILENMYEQYHIEVPWNFRQILDYRTMLTVAKLKYGYEETKSNTHDAMDDAVNQAQNLVNILNLMDRR